MSSKGLPLAEFREIQQLMRSVSVPIGMQPIVCEHVAAKTLDDWRAQPQPQPFVWDIASLLQVVLCLDCTNDLDDAIRRYHVQLGVPYEHED